MQLGTSSRIDAQGLTRTALRLEADRRWRYWALQAAGWSGLCVITFASLTLWYNGVAAAYIVHTVLQAGIGLVLSHAMRAGFQLLWRAPLPRRFVLGAGLVLLTSLIWTALRIETFMLLTNETGLWSDFGGWFFGSVLVMIAWALAYHGIKFYDLMVREKERAGRARFVADQERLRRVTAEAAARDAQLRMLRYQINPHFLFNTLNSVGALIKTDRGHDAVDMLGELSRFLRSTLREDVAVTTTLADEVAMLRLYLGIEQKRFRERLAVRFDVEDAAASALLPSLILQPLVENSVKYAVAPHPGPTEIRLQAATIGDRLRIVIEDSNAASPDGRAPKLASSEERGVGLANVKDRLGAEFGEEARFASGTTGDGGWRTEIEVPARTMSDSATEGEVTLTRSEAG